ncbi:MAG: NUDIX domain-containing protein [Hyphomonas sp.]|uniref:NUDIX domain-containing protein n=1 Tax=Hyphomonas sp. TaxID=87 RepID=UPI003527650D
MLSFRSRVFQAWFRISRPLTLGVRGAVEDENGRVFLVRHTYTPGWFLPGGGVEKGETTLTALTRELEEEGGFRLTGAPHLVGIYSNHFVFPNDHVLLYRVPAGHWAAGEATSRGEIAETVWADPLDPPDGTTPGTRLKLAELYGGAPPTPYWAPPS